MAAHPSSQKLRDVGAALGLVWLLLHGVPLLLVWLAYTPTLLHGGFDPVGLAGGYVLLAMQLSLGLPAFLLSSGLLALPVGALLCLVRLPPTWRGWIAGATGILLYVTLGARPLCGLLAGVVLAEIGLVALKHGEAIGQWRWPHWLAVVGGWAALLALAAILTLRPSFGRALQAEEQWRAADPVRPWGRRTLATPVWLIDFSSRNKSSGQSTGLQLQGVWVLRFADQREPYKQSGRVFVPFAGGPAYAQPDGREPTPMLGILP